MASSAARVRRDRFMFEILTTDEHLPETETDGVPCVYGKIVIGDFQERFATSLAVWSPDEYHLHWRNALQRLVTGGDRTDLITDYVEPPAHPYSGGYLFWWPLYRAGDAVYVQNHILFFKQLSQPFSAERPWDSVRDRRVVNEDGQKVPEWATTVDDIKHFLSQH
jgi:CdiI N-terminal domain